MCVSSERNRVNCRCQITGAASRLFQESSQAKITAAEVNELLHPFGGPPAAADQAATAAGHGEKEASDNDDDDDDNEPLLPGEAATRTKPKAKAGGPKRKRDIGDDADELEVVALEQSADTISKKMSRCKGADELPEPDYKALQKAVAKKQKQLQKKKAGVASSSVDSIPLCERLVSLNDKLVSLLDLIKHFRVFSKKKSLANGKLFTDAYSKSSNYGVNPGDLPLLLKLSAEDARIEGLRT